VGLGEKGGNAEGCKEEGDCELERVHGGIAILHKSC
jgi:hypothetical protein